VSASIGAPNPDAATPLDRAESAPAIFNFYPRDASSADLRLNHLRDRAPASKAWEFRWTP
jgi:hypothetical protein